MDATLRERIAGRADSLQRHADTIYGVLAACDPVSLPEGYNGTEESYWRLVINNERLGFSEDETRRAFNSNEPLNWIEFRRFAQRFASYDDLSSQILSGLDKLGRKTYRQSNQAGGRLAEMRFFEKMLTRRLTQDNYLEVEHLLAKPQNGTKLVA